MYLPCQVYVANRNIHLLSGKCQCACYTYSTRDLCIKHSLTPPPLPTKDILATSVPHSPEDHMNSITLGTTLYFCHMYATMLRIKVYVTACVQIANEL